MSKINDEKTKKTIDKVKDQLEKRIGFYDRIEELGLSFQEKGQKLVRFARTGKQCTRYQMNEAPKIAGASVEFPEFKDTLTRWYESGFNINSYLGTAIDDLTKGSEYVDTALYGVSTATASGSAEIDSTVTDITLAQTKNEEGNLYKEYDFQVPTALNREYMISELDFELGQVDEKLPTRRKGAWDAFDSASRDKKLQATSSMRQILRDLISKWASNDEVKTADWWKKQKKPEGKVIFKERLRFLLFGPNEIIDKFLLNKVNGLHPVMDN